VNGVEEKKVPRAMSKMVFLDTNVYLHYQLFDQVDWLDIVDAESAMIVVPPVTIRELNKLKDFYSRPRIKKRAGKVLKKLSALFNSTSEAHLRDRVDIRLEGRDPAIDFAAYQLRLEIQDDHLIASIIMYRKEMMEAEIVLVTSDNGLALLAKAREQDILTVEMPNRMKIAEQPDPAQEKIKQLEQEIRELKSRVPRLSLIFGDGSQHVAFMLPAPLESEPDELERKLNEIKQRYPKKEESERPSESGRTVRSRSVLELMAAGGMFVVSPKEIERYNTALDEFYQAYSKYLAARIEYENFERRSVKLEILLTNDGTAPAEDTEVFLHFPGGFVLMDERSYPRAPEIPDPPVKPRTPMQILEEQVDRPLVNVPWLSHDQGTIALSPNVSAPDIKRTNSYDVHFHIEKLKHGLQEAFVPLYVVFDSFEGASSFQIDYQVLAANVPHEITGQLHVVVHKAERGS